jgi:hypothetical protein
VGIELVMVEEVDALVAPVQVKVQIDQRDLGPRPSSVPAS